MNATQAFATLTIPAARMLAVEILLAEPEALADDVLEYCHRYRQLSRQPVLRKVCAWLDEHGGSAIVAEYKNSMRPGS